ARLVPTRPRASAGRKAVRTPQAVCYPLTARPDRGLDRRPTAPSACAGSGSQRLRCAGSTSGGSHPAPAPATRRPAAQWQCGTLRVAAVVAANPGAQVLLAGWAAVGGRVLWRDVDVEERKASAMKPSSVDARVRKLAEPPGAHARRRGDGA